MLIKFEEHESLTRTRQGGRIVKEQVVPMLNSATGIDPVVFDFSGVSAISSSFADELFGKLISDMGFDNFKSVTTFRNINPLVTNVIKNSIYHRNSDNLD